ncbi:urease accessory protein UreD [Rhodobacteraceae bacterium D3-12]|nr:urease accessory protein UreD [Rhodobacteraceae bacterium D3-12]
MRQSGSSKFLFPRTGGDALEAVILNTAGGVTGGDRFAMTARAGQGTALALTTQACERAYRAQPGLTGTMRNRLTVGEGARVSWLPQETILFEGSALDRRLHVEMAADAALLMVEPIVLGRAAMGERLHDIRFRDRIEIWRDGAPLYLDAMTLNGDAERQMAGPVTGAGAGAMASVVYVNRDAEAHLEPLRGLLAGAAGVSLIGEDMLVARLLAADSFELRKTLIPVLRRLSGGTLPRCWMI